MIEVNPRVKDALRSGNYRKNYRILVLNDDGTTASTITNTELVTESVKIDERLCSGDDLKFGLCEGASIEFQYFDHDTTNIGNIRGKRIQVFVDVQYKDANGDEAWEPIPLGYFDVQECSTQFSTGIIKAVCYNKLRSEYLDQKANEKIMSEYADMSDVKVGDILNYLLNGFSIEGKTEDVQYSGGQESDRGYSSVNFTAAINGDIGPLSILPTLTTLQSMGVDVYTPGWGFGELGGPCPYPVRIRMNVDFDAIDDVIHDFLVDHISRFSSNKTTEQIIGGLYNGISIDGINVPVPIFGFLVEYINIVGGQPQTSYAVYGKWAMHYGYGVGTAYDLNRISLDNVNTVFLIYPDAIFKQTPQTVTQTLFLTNVDSWRPADGARTYKYVTGSPGSYVEQTGTYYYPDGIKDIRDRLETYVRGYKVIEHNPMDDVEINPVNIADVTLRELQSAVFETAAEFGQLSRTTDLFGGVQLSRDRLFPSDDLYPSNNLYPQGVVESSFRSQYSKLWTDSVGVQTFRNLYITYKTLVDDGQGNLREQEVIMSRVVNADGTTDYDCSDNWLFKNLVWTEAQVAQYADAMVLKMRGIKWFPFEMWAAGLPYIEVGDELEINTKDGTYTSYVLQRQLTGIQNLQDTYINGSLDIF